MAFYSGMNYGLPVNYQIPAVVQQPVMPPQVQNNVHGNTGIVWVQGEAGAKAYPVQPGNSILLMDSESEVFYIKSTDASGVPLPLRIFAYNEIVQSQPVQQSAPQTNETCKYVTIDEFEELKRQIEQLTARQTRKDNRANEQIIPRNGSTK